MDADRKRLWISGQFIEVSEEVYAVYMQGDRKMRYFENDLKTERTVLDKEGRVVKVIPSREDSRDRLAEDQAAQFADRYESVEEAVLRRLSIQELYQALEQLSQSEKALIKAIFFDGKTEGNMRRNWAYIIMRYIPGKCVSLKN
ncbi:sigma-70 family RNA polymerase sigma factor [Coprococcus sp. CLA-AA-H190]|uniref:Sigma-70 family RNA polymerase sigma factor n=1 Tax=Coprococcus intestinihominis TaxID=3133154 RepID=A0ABV1B9V1_9FIRM